MTGSEHDGGPVVRLPTARRPGPDEAPFLQPVPFAACRHYGSFVVDSPAGICKCMDCGEAVSPMFVLERLMREESRWMVARRHHEEQMQRLAERSRCKCQHCGQMTRVGLR